MTMFSKIACLVLAAAMFAPAALMTMGQAAMI